MSLIDRYVTADAGGGGVGTFADPWTFDEAVAAYAPGDRVNVIEDTYTLGNITISTSATHNGPIVWRGRNATDDGDGRPVLNMGGSTFNISANNIIFYNFDVSDTYINFSGDGSTLYKCKLYNNGTTLTAADNSIINCLFYNSSTDPTSCCIIGSRILVDGCKLITNSGAITVDIGSKPSCIVNTIMINNNNDNNNPAIYSPFSTGIVGYLIQNCTIYNFKNGLVFDTCPYLGGAYFISIINNLFHSCISDNPSLDGFAIKSEHTEAPSTYPLISTLHIINNAYYNCSGGFHNLGNNPDIETIECTDDPFSNISAGDFSLNNAPNGGALLRNTGSSPAYNWE